MCVCVCIRGNENDEAECEGVYSSWPTTPAGAVETGCVQ